MARSPAGPRKSQGPRGPAVTRAPRGADRHQRPPTGPLSVTADRSHTHERRPMGRSEPFARWLRGSRARSGVRARLRSGSKIVMDALRMLAIEIGPAMRDLSRWRSGLGRSATRFDSLSEHDLDRVSRAGVENDIRLGYGRFRFRATSGSAPRNTARHCGIRLGTAEYGSAPRNTARHCGIRLDTAEYGAGPDGCEDRSNFGCWPFPLSSGGERCRRVYRDGTSGIRTRTAP